MKDKKFCPWCGLGLTEKFTEGRMRQYCCACALPVYENPVPATSVVVVDKDDRILLVKRNIEPKTGWWCLPGGFLETGESPEQGALRELREETGICGKIDMLLGVLTNEGRFYKAILMIGFLVRNFSGTAHAGDDADQAAWFDKDRLPEIAFNSHLSLIRIYYAGYRQHMADSACSP
ncbi:MAG: NUDIX domain-containing protein [Desulfobacterales bacterium]|nr:NUDIX domain-containing protein [Desulfobacterales bacterium]